MSNSKEDSKNALSGLDYGQLMKHNTNGAIIEAFVSYLFSEKKEFSKDMVVMMVRNMVIILCVKMLVEESKTYLDKLKISNLNSVRHFWQWMRYSEVSYDIVLVSDKWVHDGNIVLSKNLMTSFFEPKGIIISQPNTYYMTFGSYLLKIVVTSNKISIKGPKVDAVKKHIVDNMIIPIREHLMGGTTMMFRINFNTSATSNFMKLESVKQTYAVETDNYRDLKRSIKSMFLIEDVLKFPSKPFCINFDGLPGTGKTTFGSYIASEGIFDRVIMYNMIQQFKDTFSNTITQLERQLGNGSNREKKIDDEPESVLIILDEIDKWLASYIEIQINKCREDARVKRDIVKGEKEGGSIVETHAKLSLEEEKDKASAIKNEFLDQLFNLVEGHILADTRRYVIIFNTNNFDDMFKNVPERYTALVDRFQKYKFDKIGKKEIITYIDDITNRFTERIKSEETSGKKFDSQNIASLINYDRSILETIPDNIKISYRHMLKILRTNRYEIPILIKELRSLQEEEDCSE